jgi:hypothetical protein
MEVDLRHMTRIRSLAHYVDEVARQLEAWREQSGSLLEPVFRGQVDVHWELIPGLLRSGPYSRHTEDRLLHEFQRAARPFLQQPPLGFLQWMALAQHHGLPTRLLDWSESALVALFFALQEHHCFDGTPRPPHTEDACVWLLNRDVLHARYHLPAQIILVDAAERAWPPQLQALVAGECEGVLVFTPAHVSSRMPVQKAAFTLFGSQADTLEKLRDDALILQQFVIARERVARLRHELEMAGITRSTLFPDLDGVASEVWERELRRNPRRLSAR